MKITNIQKYVQEKYNLHTPSQDRELEVNQLLQSTFEQGNNCTITAITEQLNRFTEKAPRTIYGVVKSVAIKFGYRPNKRGTNPLFINMITRRAAEELEISNLYCSSFYFKPFIWNKIVRCIDYDTAVILNLWNANDKYYHDHSVLIIGYTIYEDKKFLKIYDGWNNGITYIDFQTLSFICSINPMKQFR